MLDADVFVLTAEGVSIAGIVGVFSTFDAAKAAAEEVKPQTDGYHAFYVRPMKLDQAYEGQFPYGGARRLEYLEKQIEGVPV
jgi:hypothetical protein